MTPSKPSARRTGVTSVIVISLLQFGQISIVGTMEHISLVLTTSPFARRNVGASEKAHPGVGACQSEKQELRTGPVALRQRLDRQHCAPIICKSRENDRRRSSMSPRWYTPAITGLPIATTAPRPPAVVPQGVADGASV